MLGQRHVVLLTATLAVLAAAAAVVAAGPANVEKAPTSRRTGQRVSCEEVVSKVDHNKTAQQGHSVSVIAVAKALGVRPFWVEQCMAAFGRRLPRKLEQESGESAREERIERLEEEEAEESFPEDVEESDDKGEVESHTEKPAKLERPTPRTRDEVQKEFEEQFQVY